jgi:hypothetical protein
MQNHARDILYYFYYYYGRIGQDGPWTNTSVEVWNESIKCTIGKKIACKINMCVQGGLIQLTSSKMADTLKHELMNNNEIYAWEIKVYPKWRNFCNQLYLRF